MNPAIRFYAMRYNNGKTNIPAFVDKDEVIAYAKQLRDQAEPK